ncbi:MAG: DUF6179 domain-containing protein [Firmicutes bacterium]|nr:DUF6179 domain-containing protein [Bacillota bacterium]
MMNNELEKKHLIDKARLSGDNYFQSLIEQACDKGILGKSDIERIQYECLSLLAEKVERYNSGDSSSIRVEKAKEILDSIFFTISLCLKAYLQPEDAAACLLHNPVKELYRDGRKKLDIMLAATKAVHAKLTSQLINTPNVFYSSTLKDGINGFFKLYHPDFFAHETHITADYPLFNTIPKLNGIEFIRAYVGAAYYENQFLKNFSADNIHHLLCGCDENYQELLINLYEPILTASLGCVTAGIDPYRLDITLQGIDLIEDKFGQKSKAEISEIVSNAAVILCEKLKCSEGLSRYIQNSLEKIVDIISRGVSENSLNRIFVLPAYPEDKPKIIFSYGTKMDDELYRNVINEISECGSLRDKILIIKEYIHSLADLEDVLLDTEMNSPEIQAVLEELSLYEIAALSKKYFLFFDADTTNYREREMLLRESLKIFVSALPPEKQEMLKKAVSVLKEE